MWQYLILLSFASLLATVNCGTFHEFEILFKSKKVLNFEDFTLKTSATSYSCNALLSHLAKNLPSRDLWARKMRDSWGGVPSGVYSGNAVDFGNYDQCVNIDESSSIGHVVGQHCILSIPFERYEEPRSEKMGTSFKP